MTDEIIPNTQRPDATASTWLRVVQLIEAHTDVKQVRLNMNEHSVSIGFYDTPSEETLDQIKNDVRAALSGQWDVSITPDDKSPTIHLHKLDNYTTEFHRAHPSDEPPVIWKRIALPTWRNRPFPRPVPRDYRFMLLLAAICGVSTLTGFLLGRAGIRADLLTPFFALAYVCGGWFATQDVWHALKRGKVDIQFLMVAVAVGALFVKGWTEGATLLFLFSLSNGLEQFANYRTRKSIESLLKVAPKHAFRREDRRWVEAPIEQVQIGNELLVKPGELFPVDGVIIEGATPADESASKGEAIPVVKQIGDVVSGGTLNLDGQSVIRATRRLGESALSRILDVIEMAQQQKAPAQRFTNNFSRYYTWITLSLAAVVFVVLLLMHRPVADAFYRSLTVLVVASPCRAGLIGSVCDFGRHCCRCSGSDFVPRRCCRRKSRRGDPVRVRQNRDTDERRAGCREDRVV